MKRKFLAILMAAAAVLAAQAQGARSGGGKTDSGAADKPEVERGAQEKPDSAGEESEALRTMERLKLQPQERESIRRMLQEGEDELARIRAELREMQARMTRLMLQERVDRPEIERTLRRGVELEFEQRMIQVERQIRIKEMLGAERWAAMYRLAQMAQAAERAGKLDDFLSRAEDPAQARLLVQILRGLY